MNNEIMGICGKKVKLVLKDGSVIVGVVEDWNDAIP